MCVISSIMPRGICRLHERVKSWLRDAKARRRLAREFGRLGSRDLDRVLTEIGCSREELSVLIHNAPRSRPLLDGMIFRLGLEREFALGDAELVRDIERRCATCAAQGRCDAWLRAGRASDDYRLFCPNAGNFGLLAGKTARTGDVVPETAMLG